MDCFKNHYMLLLSPEEQQLLKLYLENPQVTNKTLLNHKPFHLLREKPYPVLDILLQQPAHNHGPIECVIIKTFENFVKRIAKTGVTPNFLKFLIKIPEDMLNNALHGKLRAEFQQCLDNSTLNDQFYLSLLARNDKKLVHDIQEYLKEAQWRHFRAPLGTKHFVLYLALKSGRHFINALIKENSDFHDINDVTLRNNLIILKLVHELSVIDQRLETLPQIQPLLDLIDLENIEEELKSMFSHFYKDFKRLEVLISYIQNYPNAYNSINVCEVLSALSPLEVINKHRLLNTFDDAKAFMESYYGWQTNTPLLELKNKELEVLSYFWILSTCCDIITYHSPTAREEMYEEKMQILNSLFRQVKNFDLLCTILDDVLKCIFLRWEHFIKNCNAGQSRLHSSCSTSSTNDVILRSFSKPSKTGFVCKSKSFILILSFLKTFVTKKLHSADFKQSTCETKQHFQMIVDNIADLMWKYDFFNKIEQSQKENLNKNSIIYVDLDGLVDFVHFHADPLQHESSDDEDNLNEKLHSWQLRRKAVNKRRRATFSGTSAATDNGKLNLRQSRGRTNAMPNTAYTVECPKRQSESKAANMSLPDEEERSIIPKLLSSPERLAELTLSLKQFAETKQIIENFGLHDSQLDLDLQYMEQQHQVKQKLVTIYDNYQHQERQTRNANEPLATVEQIRNVAAKGFEVSKIISVIDHFALIQRISQTESIKGLLQKHKSNPQYRFLSHFEEANLNAVIICDLILSLPFNRDITASVLMVIKLHQAIQSSFGENEHTEKSQLPTKIGPLNFLENLTDCMRILGDKSLKDLLCDNIYSLRPQKLSEELEREQIFRNVFYKNLKEVNSCTDLKALAPQFQSLKSKYNYYQRFCSYVHHLDKLLRLRDRNRSYHVEQLLKFDPRDVIGDLLFCRNMTPLEIEPIVTSLNLCLVHVILLNICPEIMAKSSIKKRQLTVKNESTVLNYISIYNRLLVFLLQCIINESKTSNDMCDEHINSVFIERLLHMPEILTLSSLYGGNKVIAALRSDHVSVTTLAQMENKMNQFQLMQLEIGIQEPKPFKSKRMDDLIMDIIHQDAKNIHLAAKINDIGVRATLIYENFTKITTTRLAKELIESTLHHRQAVQMIPQALHQKLETTLTEITVYTKVSDIMQFETWPQAYDFGLKTPTTIFKRLLQLHLYKLCYEWCQVIKLSENFQLQRKQIMNILLEALIECSDDEELNACEYLLKILDTFPPGDRKAFLELNKDKFRSLVLLKYTIDYLRTFADNGLKKYTKNYKISIVILEQLTPGIRQFFWKLLKYPLLIIEQLLMNSKFEVLNNVLSAVRLELQTADDGQDDESKKLCAYCFDKKGNIYDIQAKTSNTPQKTRFQLGSHETSTSSAFVLLSFNLYQQDHIVGNDCIDLLLRVYATKALDYQISDTSSSQSTCDTQQSLDSLCGVFQMPGQAPARSEWVRDEAATHCMCCRRAAFSMLMRRHHCRLCGRVVCFACSPHRMRIPDLYQDVEVRICNDCKSMCDDINQQKAPRDSQSAQPEDAENSPLRAPLTPDERFKWKLSGSITHDKLLREEFCYEHAPSVALCLSILDFHLDDQKCVDLLLLYCRKLQTFFIPNPEVDFELLAKMMNCLALAAKVRGGPAVVDAVKEEYEIMISMVHNGCGSLIPQDLRKLGDLLLQEERWDLALKVRLKTGNPAIEVMAAHGFCCLKAGCYDTAREKFNHCMTKLTNDTTTTAITKVIFSPALGAPTNDNVDAVLGLTKDQSINIVKRPLVGPHLLQEILKLLESLPFNKTQEETLHRASVIRNSNSSFVSLLSRRKESYVKRMHAPAINILNTLANLKHITKGHYTSNSNNAAASNSEQPMQRKQFFLKTRSFEECVHYVLTYGSHIDVIQFLMHHEDLMASLKYYLLQNLDADIFVHHIYLELLKRGRISQLIKMLHEFDNRLVLWRPTLLHTCRYLETQNLLNSLYQLQVLLNDPVRAAMTCVKFYTMNCDTFQQQHINAQHLRIAQNHLQSELENTQWEAVNFNIKPSTKPQSRRLSTTSSNGGGIFQLQMDARSLNAHINTILKQLEVAKFLSTCEVENSGPKELLTIKYLKQICNESHKGLPTLFDKAPEKVQICILILLCGKSIYGGYGLAYRIIQHYKLKPMKVYAATAKYLALNERLSDVEKLINCITSNNGFSSQDKDEILSVAINSADNTHKPEVRAALDNYTKKIQNIELRISSYIFIGQLKSAYLLANKYNRLGDIRKILRKAEVTNQVHIKKVCEKKLEMSLSGSDESN